MIARLLNGQHKLFVIRIPRGIETLAYHIKEVFYSIQGEGFHTGKPMVFCRFSGCNLWSGLEKHRDQAQCQFCDTDFVGTDGEGGGVFEEASELYQHLLSFWPGPKESLWIEFTGGEPSLQLDTEMIKYCKEQGASLSIESNGTRELPHGLDWICISPKSGVGLKQKNGHELKLIFPQKGLSPEEFKNCDFQTFYLQPMDGPDLERNRQLAVEYCLEHPEWNLSMQIHKTLHIK